MVVNTEEKKEKKLSKIEKLENDLKKARKAEREKYEKKREKYRLRMGKALDDILDGKDLDLTAWKKYVKQYKIAIIQSCEKKDNSK